MSKKNGRKLGAKIILAAVLANFSGVGVLAQGAATSTETMANVQARGNYIWQAAEQGKLFGVDNPRIFGGYQFKALKDGYATELCGYFVGNYYVELFDDNFELVASAPISSYDQWNCAGIVPKKIEAGKEYFVVAEIDKGQMYYRSNDAGVLPLKGKDVAIIAGVTQKIDFSFGDKLKFDDKKIFGLVDMKFTQVNDAESLLKAAKASLAGVGGDFGGRINNFNFYNCGGGKCIVCDKVKCGFENDNNSKSQAGPVFLQVCLVGVCYSCTNGNCGQAAMGNGGGNYYFKKCTDNKCVNCFEGGCSVSGGEIPRYQYFGDFTGGAVGGSSAYGWSFGLSSGIFNNLGFGSSAGLDDLGGGDAPTWADIQRAIIAGRFNDPDVQAALKGWGVSDAVLTKFSSSTPEQQLEALMGLAQTPGLEALAQAIKSETLPAGEVRIEGDKACVGSVCFDTAAIGSGNANAIVDQINARGSVSSRTSDLTTGWADNMNNPNIYDYIQVKIDPNKIGASNQVRVPLVTYDQKTGNVIPVGTTYVTLDNNQISALKSGAVLSVPVRYSEPAAGLLNNGTGAQFSAGSKETFVITEGKIGSDSFESAGMENGKQIYAYTHNGEDGTEVYKIGDGMPGGTLASQIPQTISSNETEWLGNTGTIGSTKSASQVFDPGGSSKTEVILDNSKEVEWLGSGATIGSTKSAEQVFNPDGSSINKIGSEAGKDGVMEIDSGALPFPSEGLSAAFGAPSGAAEEESDWIDWGGEGDGSTGGGMELPVGHIGTTGDTAAGGGGTGTNSGSAAKVVPSGVVPVVTNKTITPQGTANPVLAVGSDRTTNCQYAANSFSYGSGTMFGTTGNYDHNTTLTSVKNGNYTYYVICKDTATGGVSVVQTIPLKIDLSLDANNAPVITNTTADHQISNEPALSVSTLRNASCQYKEGRNFTYGLGSSFSDDGGTSHSVSIAALADGGHTFYVVCKDTDTEAINASGKQILTTLDRAANPQNAPVINNATEPAQITLTPTLAATTAKAAECQYKENSNFVYGEGNKFEIDGNTNHSVKLEKVSEGLHTYYVVCKDKASNAINSQGMQIIFTATDAVPKITNTTAQKQTGDQPMLGVTTNRKSECQYKQDNDFIYGQGTQMTTEDNFGHQASLENMANGTYVFYVACKDSATETVSLSGQKVTTVIEKISKTLMVINNTANYQKTSEPVLEAATNREAACQYKENSDFAYGQGVMFDTDDGLSHKAKFSKTGNGSHIYFVVCKDIANGVMSSSGFSITVMVEVATSQDSECEDLLSNDRKNDNNRSNVVGEKNTDSGYLWQSVESGKREKFEKVNWYAGYQFTPMKDGQITQLCGYFDSGATNKVSLFDGQYEELAIVDISGNGAWKCADIAATAVKTDKRYYVIATVENKPLYFEYETGMLPKTTNNVVIEAGIRQSNANFVQYDYMIFGLVDAKINFSADNNAGPKLAVLDPSGNVSGLGTILSVTTSEAANCRFDRNDVKYEEMRYTLVEAADKIYEKKVCGLESGLYTFYVRCKSAVDQEKNNASGIIQFKAGTKNSTSYYDKRGRAKIAKANSTFDKTIRFANASLAQADSGSKDALSGLMGKSDFKIVDYDPAVSNSEKPAISIETNKKAICRAAPYNVAYEKMWSEMATEDGKIHKKQFGKLPDGSYDLYFKCKDEGGREAAKMITFTVNKSYDPNASVDNLGAGQFETNVLRSNYGQAVQLKANGLGQIKNGQVIVYIRDSNGQYVVIATMDKTDDGKSWFYKLDTLGLSAGKYQVDARIDDGYGNFVRQDKTTNFVLAEMAINSEGMPSYCKVFQKNGERDSKIDIVIIPCGYGNDMESFRIDSQTQAGQFLSFEPILKNKGKFNFYNAEIEGLDCSAKLNDNMIKDANLFISIGKLCGADAVMVLKKGMDKGGVSLIGSKIGFAAARDNGAMAHELGHALFDLDDEYSYGCTYKDMTDSPNCSNEPKCTKWQGVAGAECLAGCTCEGNYRSSSDGVMFDPGKATQFSAASGRQINKIVSLF